MASESGFSMEEFESLMATSDVELLKRAWRNEKSAPEILQFQSSLVMRIREQIQLMEETIEEFTRSGFDPLIVSIYQMDMDRAQYMLRSYLRTRLQKIEKNMIHFSKTDLWNRLSKEEQSFAKRCYENMKSYLDESVLSKLPTGYQSDLKQSNASEENDMVPEPNLDTFVFCKSDSSIGAIPLDDSADEIVDLVAGDLYVLRYKSIKPFVENGQIDLV
ncbi:DNA replication complex GINS protein SLD5-like isoform X2 [Chenopodium quinoa]|uniref:DNA replication complex GINS protein SLD5-like isoform X2 n=1 Tax=Chenopodium quinoa TaxID=63459 RepID=UPI000B77A50F|nr:DNA replication complex GINS protein SLD5-like isoform X2 [Chenopodium quinoa]